VKSKYYGANGKNIISFEVNYLSYILVLNNALHAKLLEMKKDYRLEVRDGLPFVFAHKNYEERLELLFDKFSFYLLQDIDENELSRKTVFIRTRLKELRRRELEFKSKARITGINYQNKYTTSLREFLELEEESLNIEKYIEVKLPDILINNKVQEERISSDQYRN